LNNPPPLGTQLQVIKSRIIKWAGHAARMRERTGVYGVLVGKSKGKRPLGRLSIDVKIILKWFFKQWNGGVDWSYLAQHKYRWRTPANSVMNFLVPYNAENFSTG